MQELKEYPISIAEVVRSRTIVRNYVRPTQLLHYEGLSRLIGDQYVGENPLVATLLGIIAAVQYVFVGLGMNVCGKQQWYMWLLLGLWLVALLHLRFHMKRAVDLMELAWVCERIDWGARSRVMAASTLKQAAIKAGWWERIWRWLHR